MLVCWVQVAVAIGYVLLAFYNHITRPALQIELDGGGRRLLSVTPDGAADRAGLRPGDTIVSINDEPVTSGLASLYVVEAGQAVPVVFERGGQRQTTQVVPVTLEEARREAIRLGGASTLGAIAGYMHFPLHAWMLLLGVVVLSLRPNNADARLAALTFAYWAGGSFFFEDAGLGALLAPLGVGLRTAFFLVDAFFIAAFFGACLHFALIFPTGQAVRRWAPVEFLLYVATVPIFLEAAANGVRRAASPPAAVMPVSTNVYMTFGPTLLLIALAVLAARFTRMTDLNARRRLELVFLSLLPGVLGFLVYVVVSRGGASSLWIQIGRLTMLVGTMAGSGFFAYAVVRHRMFNIRFLLRRSLQYALARGTLLTLMALPVVGLLWFLYIHRGDSITVLLTREPALYLLLIVPLLMVVIYRRRVLDAVDRRFFREQYDARRLLLHVVSMVRDGSDTLGVSRVALDEIEKALHPKHVSLWQLDVQENVFRRGIYRGAGPGAPPPLPASSALVTLLATDSEPIDLHNHQTRAMIGRLPVPERLWLGSAVAYLLVPLIFEQRLVGVMVLGERMSEEPYSREDRELLRTLAAQLAFTLDYSRLRASPSLVWQPNTAITTPPEMMKLCPSCGRCYEATQIHCDADQRALVPEEGVPRHIDDKYVITRLLGRGGMGSVYMATQKRLNRPVAMKVLLTHLVGSSSMQGRFEREARIVARLRHPGIVTIHDFGVLRTGHAYLVMEYLEGQTLRKTILSGAQPVEKMLEIIGPVGEAIESAHRAGVVHRDLKPENIMLVRNHDGEFTPRVLDFGLAKMSNPSGDEEATLVQSGHSAGLVGTLMYMAPEALSGRTADARSDQYSLALITYELLAGTHPFGTATDLASVVKGHTDLPPPPLSDRVRGISERVAKAVHRALAKKPAERFGSVAEFVEAMGG